MCAISCSKSPSDSDVGKSNPAPAKPKPAKPKLVKPDFQLTVDEYVADFKSDQKAAAKKYQKKVVELTGEVTLSGRSFIDFKSKGSRFGRLHCTTKDLQPWLRVSQGQHAVIRGIYKGYVVGGISLYNVEIIKVTGESTAVQTTAEELATEFTKDQKGTDAKYNGKQLFVTGTLRLTDASDREVIIESNNGRVGVEMSAALDLRYLKDGQKVTLAGRYRVFRTDNSLPQIDRAVVVSPVQRANVDPPRMVDGVPHFTADELAVMYRKAPREFVSRYKQQQIQVEGTLANVMRDKNGGVEMSFKNSVGHEIGATFPAYDRKVTASLAAGQKVTIQSEYGGVGAQSVKPYDSIDFSLCKLIRP